MTETIKIIYNLKDAEYASASFYWGSGTLLDKAFPVVWTNRPVESIKYIDEKLPCPNNAVHSF